MDFLFFIRNNFLVESRVFVRERNTWGSFVLSYSVVVGVGFR